MSEYILETTGLTKRFSGLVALNHLDLQVKTGSIHAIIGPNGSGKTTFFNVITGLYKPDEGEAVFNGKDITGLKPHQIGRSGIGRTFQTLCLFREMTALDNVLVGSQCQSRYPVLKDMVYGKARTKQEEERVKKACECLEFVGLLDIKDELACNLPYGKQRLLEIARAMAMDPKIILLDEPAAGMNPSESLELVNKVKAIRDSFGMSVLIIEHNMKLVMSLADTITCLDYGTKIAEGRPEEVAENRQVVEAYLGKVGEDATNSVIGRP